ncbi:MAG: glycosyltransferase family 4 protein [Pseudobdellovibrionaceae bacterium]
MSQKKRVLHLVEYLYLGGIERLLEQLAIHSKDQVHLHFYSYETQVLGGIGKSIQDMGFKVFTYKKNPGRDWKLVKDLIKVIKENKIDVVHTHDFGPTEYAVLLKLRFPRLKLIHTQHTMHHFVIKAKYRYFFQFASYFYSQIVGVSGFVKDSLIKNCPWIRKDILKIIPNGVDTKKFAPLVTEAKQTDILRLVSVARISPEKNLPYLINTCRLLKNENIPFTFNHAGTSKTPEPIEKLEKYIKDHDLLEKISLHGFCDNPIEILRMGDIYLSSSRFEGHPVAVLEAMATEKYCICSDIPPHRETSHGAIALYDANDELALFHKLKAIYTEKQDLSEKQQQARAVIIQHYSLTKMVERYGELYN